MTCLVKRHYAFFIASSCLSVRLSVASPVSNSKDTNGRIFKKFDVSVFFENLPRKFKFHYNMIRTKGTLHED